MHNSWLCINAYSKTASVSKILHLIHEHAIATCITNTCIIHRTHVRWVWLGGPIRDHFKGQSRNKIWPNNILRPFSWNFFRIINYYFFMFIYCMPKYMAWSFNYNKVEIITNLYSLLMWPFQNQVLKLWKFITKLYLLK